MTSRAAALDHARAGLGPSNGENFMRGRFDVASGQSANWREFRACPFGRLVGVIVLAVMLLIAIPATAFAVPSPDASFDTEGWKTGSSAIDGTYSRLAGNQFNPTPSQCILYSVLSNDATSTRQIEAGVLRCNGSKKLDGTCPGGQVFVETYDRGTYNCVPGYSFTNDTQYDATTYRNSSTSTTFTGHINGVQQTLSGFGLSDSNIGIAWGEASGGSSCPSVVKGTFTSWERYFTTTGWGYVNNSLRVQDYQNLSGAPCWKTVTSVSATGDFSVY